MFRDIFDGDLYQQYYRRELDLFKDLYNIALQLLLDSADLTTGRNKHSVTPVILINLNLPPAVWYQAKNILASLIISSPKKYKDINSFLQLLIDELYKLEGGILLFNSNSRTEFQLHAWVILVIGREGSFRSFGVNILLGGGPAVANALGLKSPSNIKTPCRSYLFQG